MIETDLMFWTKVQLVYITQVVIGNLLLVVLSATHIGQISKFLSLGQLCLTLNVILTLTIQFLMWPPFWPGILKLYFILDTFVYKNMLNVEQRNFLRQYIFIRTQERTIGNREIILLSVDYIYICLQKYGAHLVDISYGKYALKEQVAMKTVT